MAVEHSPTERIADAHRCPQCQGLGVLAQSFSGGGPVECSLCAGSGVYRWVDGRYVHWSRRINALHITQRRLERRVQQVIDAFLLVFAIGGLLAGAGEAFGILRRYGLDLVAFLDHALTDLSEWRLLFWIGMCAALVLSYRSTRRFERRATVPTKARGFLGQMAQDPGLPFEQIRSARNRLEISSTFDQESFRIVEFAWDFAHRSRHSEVRAEHLFLSMLTSTPTIEIATRLGIDIRKLVDQLRRVVAQQPPLDIPTRLSATVRQILLVAFEDAYRNQRPHVGVPEIFLGLTAVEST
ncbi:MAG: hypothetical protein HY341_02235, partial [Candidatus Kerfeldbacteria bacterium]|nr:hypothetical protein [Candidatus Kerfeldbacteria bacterium]